MNEPRAEHNLQVSENRDLEGASQPGSIGVNGLEWDSGAPWRPPLSVQQFTQLIERFPSTADACLSLADDGEDLAQTGWGVVYGPEVGDEVREALRPLLQLRRNQADSRQRLYAELQLKEDEDAGAFLKRLDCDGQWIDPQLVPGYLLLVGDCRQIPFPVQTSFPLAYNVGRLPLSSAEEYAAYAQAAVDNELSRQLRPRRVALAGSNGGNSGRLVPPVEDLMEAVERAIIRARPSWDAMTLTQGLTTQERLSRLLSGTSETPSLLLASGRGVCSVSEGASDLLGALVCCDYVDGKLGLEHVFDQGKVPEEAPLNGLLILLQGSFTAGRPAHPLLDQMLERPPADALDAALPRRLLGHRAGAALAVVGHCENSWLHLAARSRPDEWAESMTDLLQALLGRQRVGAALQQYRRHCCRLAKVLEEDSGTDSEEGRQRLIEAWALRQEARNWILMGDPASRLPVAG
ncbi:MAG TPA: hypothetical protein VLU25_21880 [Acidobacteriota bacterium]|nr:hypothetical protein [Acidobacteriota bacterium]